jgi:hypothetical protein
MNAKVVQRVIIKFFSKRGENATEMHHSLFDPFRKILTPFRMLINGFKPSKLYGQLCWTNIGRRSRLDHVNSKMLSRCQESEFHGIRALTEELNVSLSMVHARLTHVLGFSLRHKRWVSHVLTGKFKATGVATSMKGLEILDQQERTDFAGIGTGDESWFFLECFRNHVWRVGNENVPELIAQKIDTDKPMLTIFRSSTGPLVEYWLSTNASFNSPYFCDVTVSCCASTAFPDQTEQRKRGLK